MKFRQGPIRDALPTVTVGERLDLFERGVRNSERAADLVAPVRDRVDKRINDFPIRSDNPNFTPNTMVGGVIVAAVTGIQDYVPVNTGAGAQLIDAQNQEGGTLYILDVDAPTQSMARFRAQFESGTGATSFWTDRLEVRSIEKTSTRVMRDTYRVEVFQS